MKRAFLALGLLATITAAACGGNATNAEQTKPNRSWVYACDLVSYDDLRAARRTSKDIQPSPAINTDQQCTWNDVADGQFFVNAQPHSNSAAAEKAFISMRLDEAVVYKTVQMPGVSQAVMGCDGFYGHVIFIKKDVVVSVMVIPPGAYVGIELCTKELTGLAQAVADRV